MLLYNQHSSFAWPNVKTKLRHNYFELSIALIIIVLLAAQTKYSWYAITEFSKWFQMLIFKAVNLCWRQLEKPPMSNCGVRNCLICLRDAAGITLAFSNKSIYCVCGGNFLFSYKSEHTYLKRHIWWTHACKVGKEKFK